MKAVLADRLPTGPEWGFELKWDGMRILLRCGADGAIDLRSRSGRDVTGSYPELAPIGAALATGAVLDGEVVVFDGDRPSFGRLQHRMHVERPSPQLVAEQPVVFLAFDLLELAGRPLVDLPLSDRRRVLEDLWADGPSWRLPPVVTGDGSALLRLADERDLEGVVAKRLASPYEPGSRSPDWIKVKVRRRQELVVVGWLGGQGRLAGEIGSLLVAHWEDGVLRFAGAVGSGIAARDRAQLGPLLVPASRSPLEVVPPLDRPPHWVEPAVVVEVEYGSWPAGSLLRHPVYAGLRGDVDPSTVIREIPF